MSNDVKFDRTIPFNNLPVLTLSLDIIDKEMESERFE